ncbi:TonB family protein [Aliikangiella marina]|uniref:TonB family protein n=1 Tax=Aliikangiella marina TaxID=1712262 RepID=A0A545T4G5_9GAMM|nr:TonB family protein [Aliikangiella marina]TQV72114.1 TonB family protein [Aliikangiella marina]
MKNILVLSVITLGTLSTSVSAKKLYGDVLVTDVNPKEKIHWQRTDPKTVTYPKELAMSESTGCVVLNFDVNQAGETENISIVQTNAKKKVAKYTKRMLKKWQWSPIDSSAKLNTESRTIRFDYCMSNESGEKAKAMCQQQSQLACSNKNV